MHLYNFFVCGPKFTRFLLSNLGGVVVDQLFFRFLICPPVSEIFAIKVESCQKSLQNFDIILAGVITCVQFLEGPPPKIWEGQKNVQISERLRTTFDFDRE